MSAIRRDPSDSEILDMLPNTVPKMVREWWKDEILSDFDYQSRRNHLQRRMKSLERFGYVTSIGSIWNGCTKEKMWVRI